MNQQTEMTLLLSLRDEASKKFRSFSQTIRQNSRQIGIGLSAIGAIGLLAGKRVVKSSEDQRIGISNLNQALKNVGTSYDEQRDSIEKVIEAQQRKTNFGDEQQREALQKLVIIGGTWEGALDSLAVALDVAAGANIDLNAAALLLGKAIAGETSSLSRYGILIEEGATQTQIMDAITKQFGGSAEATASSLTQLSNRLGDVAQVFGDAVLPIVSAVAFVLERLARAFTALPSAITTPIALVAGFGIIAASIMGPLILLSALIPVMAAGWTALGGAILATSGFMTATMIPAVVRLIAKMWALVAARVAALATLGPIGVAILAGSVAAAAGSFLALKKISALESGGIVTKPTLALIGEAGPEAVVPLGRGGVGSTINVILPESSLMILDNEMSRRRLVKEIALELRQTLRGQPGF